MVGMENPELSMPAPLPTPAPLGAPSAHAPALAPASHQPAGAFGEQRGIGQRLGNVRKRIGSALAALVAIVAKFFAAIKGFLLLLPKVKLLTTAGTALVSVAAYSLFFGWWFAVGFVVLLFVHEMGHVIQLRREGIKASAPMFIPFLGAVVTAQVARRERRRGGARGACRADPRHSRRRSRAGRSRKPTNSDFLRALAYFGFFLNLFNLLPVVPLDGGRAMAAMARGCGSWASAGWSRWCCCSRNPILLIILFFSGVETVAPLEAAQHALAASRPPTTAWRLATGCWSARSTSA